MKTKRFRIPYLSDTPHLLRKSILQSVKLVVCDSDSIPCRIISVGHPSSIFIDHLDEPVEFIIDIGSAYSLVDLEIGVTVIGGAHP